MFNMEQNEEIKIVYDDDNFKIIKPLTLEALCKYDKDHYFCDSRYSWHPTFTRPNTVTYIFVSKKNNSVETFRRIEDNTILDGTENEVSLSDVKKNLKDYFGVPKDITKRLLGSNFFNQLRGFLRGDISNMALRNADPMIYDVSEPFNQEPRIILSFDDFDKFLEMIGLDDDDVSFYNWVESGRWEFRTYDQDYEDMKEGYGAFWSFDKENKDKLEYISSILMPGKKFEESDEFFRELFRILYDEFPRNMDNIIYRFSDAANEQMNDSAWKNIKEELEEFFKKTGLEVQLGKDLIKLRPTEILRMYTEIGDTRMTLQELLEEYFQNKKGNLGGWYENQYEYENQREWDMEGLNDKWGQELDDIIEIMKDNSENYDKIYQLHWKMKEKYGLRKVQRTPKDPNLWFQILGIDKDTGKIATQILRTWGLEDGGSFSNGKVSKNKNHEFSEENFNLFLNQPELFDIFDEK